MKRTVLPAFAVYGLLWGLYMAALPEIKRRSGASEGELGAALLCVALTAAPAMFLTGRLLDRWGRWVAVSAAVLFAVVAPLPALAWSVPWLAVALALFGLGSGAFEVVIVSLAAAVESESGARILNQAHALFSAGLLTGSGGAAAAGALGVPAAALLVICAVLVVPGAIAARHGLPGLAGRRTSVRRRGLGADRVVLALGLLAALAMLVESGVQQWSAIFLQDVLRAPGWLAGTAPAIFAAGMIIGRLGVHRIAGSVPDRLVLALSGAHAVAGVLVLASAGHPLVALAGVALTGAAVSAITPTIYGLAGRRAQPEHRGAVIGVTTTVAYSGLLTGPVVVGVLAGLTQLRVAVASLAVVAIVIGIAALRIPLEERWKPLQQAAAA